MLRRFFFRFSSILQFLGRSRFMRIALLSAFVLWLIDSAIFFVTETQWWNANGLGAAWQVRSQTQIALWLLGVLTTLLLGWCFLQEGLRPVRGIAHLPGPYRSLAERLFKWQRTINRSVITILVLVAFWSGWSLAAHWTEYLPFLYSGEIGFGAEQWGRDVGFWMWRLPWLRRVLDTFWDVLSWLLLLAMALYGTRVALLPFEGKRPEEFSFRVSVQLALKPVFVPLALWFGARALGYWLQRQENFSPEFLVDLRFHVGVVFCILTSVWLLIWRWRTNNIRSNEKLRWGRRATIFFLLSLSSLVFPLVLQRGLIWLGHGSSVVQPDATRFAWGLDTIEVQQFSLTGEVSDASRLQRAAQKLQTSPPILVSSLKLFPAEENSVSYFNRQRENDGAVPFTASVSPQGTLKIWQWDKNKGSRVPGKNEAIVIGRPERGWYTTADVSSPGISLGSMWNRLVWAWRLRSPSLFFAEPDKSLLPFTDPVEVAQNVVPFLQVGGEPYPILTSGRIVWMLDLLSTPRNFPGSLSTHIEDAVQLEAARDSVKMCMDAQTGAISFYAVQKNETFMAPWLQAFGNLIQSESAMPSEMRMARRYPTKLFRAQRAILQRLKDLPFATEDEQFGFQTLPDVSTQVFTSHFVLQSWIRGEEITALLADCDDYGRLKIWRFKADVKSSRRQAHGKTQLWWPVWERVNGQTRLLELVTVEPQYEGTGETLQLSRVRIEDAFAPNLNASGTDWPSTLRAFAQAGKMQRSFEELAREALRTHQAMQYAASAGEWARYGELSKQHEAVLQKMAERAENQ